MYCSGCVDRSIGQDLCGLGSVGYSGYRIYPGLEKVVALHLDTTQKTLIGSPVRCEIMYTVRAEFAGLQFGRVMGRQMVTPHNTVPSNLSGLDDARSRCRRVCFVLSVPDIYSSIIRRL